LQQIEVTDVQGLASQDVCPILACSLLELVENRPPGRDTGTYPVEGWFPATILFPGNKTGESKDIATDKVPG